MFGGEVWSMERGLKVGRARQAGGCWGSVRKSVTIGSDCLVSEVGARKFSSDPEACSTAFMDTVSEPEIRTH